MRWEWAPRIRGRRAGDAVGEGKTAKGERKGEEEEAKVRDVVEEVERHWRGLHRKEELAG